MWRATLAELETDAGKMTPESMALLASGERESSLSEERGRREVGNEERCNGEDGSVILHG
jgi:hypothetical protein